MSNNPTREDIKEVLGDVADHYGRHGSCCECADLKWMCDFALRALDMHDDVKQGLGGPIQNAETVEEALGEIHKAIKKFDRGGDG